MDRRRFDRTGEGHDEIAQGRKNVRGKLRTVLFLVDPNKTVDEILQQMSVIGAPTDALAQLEAGGYIREISGAPGAAPAGPAAARAPAPTDDVSRFRMAKAFINETVVDVLGIRAFVFTLKLERCATLQDLQALLPDFAAALAKKLDANAARALAQRARELVTPASS